MKRILVPTDFSKEAENGLQTAMPIARVFDATIVLLHVLEVSGGDNLNTSGGAPFSDAMYIHEGLKLAQDNLNRSIILHGLDEGEIKLEKFIRIGTAAKQIEESIEKLDIDFVVMGTKTAVDINELVLGTSTDKLIRKVNCPILSVNHVVSADAFKNIIFPTTTLNKEGHLIGIIKTFQEAFESKINMVRINTPLRFIPDEAAYKLLEEYASANGLKNYQCHVYSHTEEEDGILAFARTMDESIIAVSTSAHTGLRKVLQGSVTKELVGHAKRPVLTMKMDEASR